MSMTTNVRSAVIAWLVPLARLYIRYVPFGMFKPFLWARVGWRSVQGYIYHFGVWEPNLTAFIERRLAGQTGRTFVDVGANVGYFSLLAAKTMPGGNVVAIEAFPSIYAKLQENIGLNAFRNIRTVPCAATQNDCEIEMFYAGSENEGGTTTVPGRFSATPVRVRGKPLTDILTDYEVRSMRIMKIDVEGGEHAVIHGMRLILDKLQPDAEIIVEVTPDALGSEKMAEIFTLFESAGYMPYGIENIYAASYYLSPAEISRPERIRMLPNEQTDVVFSKVDADYL